MTLNDEERQVLTDPEGQPLLTYVRGERAGRPWADLVRVTGTADPIPVVLAALSGWVVSGSVQLGEELIRHGARTLRHAHGMRRDLVAEPLVAVPLPHGARVVPCDRSPRALLPAWRAAFGPGHPDHHPGTDEEAYAERLVPLLDGTVLGPVLPSSVLAVDPADRVLAGVIVTDRGGQPWIAEVFRAPGDRYAGLGAALLRHALADAADRGLTSVELAVTDGNPARRGYERLGFVRTSTALTVVVP
ncbi:GNAT family N-acetyltransferase [Streptomyces sp. NPDC005955]|uniref:GNAT family N-acetyltransferase n=1 Tax=Streptomyces sp. NPDC005955 TaxID=3364738 RepID=UPI0036D05B47